MQGAFEQGSILWYWYDGWVVIPFMFIALIMVIRLGLSLNTPGSALATLGAILVSILGTVPLVVVAFDRIGIGSIYTDPATFGYASIAGAALAITLGLGVPILLPHLIRRGILGGQGSPTPDAPMGAEIVPGDQLPTASGLGYGGAASPAVGFQDEATAQAGVGPTQVGAPSPGAGETMVLGAASGAAWLLVQQGAEAGQSFPLRGDTTNIGRSSDSNIRLEDPAVSNGHALICKIDDRYILYDTGSSGGTRVNGQTVTGGTLREGSRITLGSSELEFSLIEGGAPASPGETIVLSQEKRGTLLVRSGPGAGQSFTLGAETVIGREPGPGGVALNDPAVSRRHALVKQTGEGYAIYDLGSANGTVVDGDQLQGRTLQNEDTIELGATVLKFGQS